MSVWFNFKSHKFHKERGTLTRRIGLILDLCEATVGPVREKSRDKASMLGLVWNGRKGT